MVFTRPSLGYSTAAERLEQFDTLAVDKTGTLTGGKSVLASIAVEGCLFLVRRALALGCNRP